MVHTPDTNTGNNPNVEPLQRVIGNINRLDAQQKAELLNQILSPLASRGDITINNPDIIAAPASAEVASNHQIPTGGNTQPNGHPENGSANEARKTWLKKVVDSRAANITDKTLAIALSFDPTLISRVAYEGFSTVMKNIANGETDKVIKNLAYYGVRTAAAASSGGLTEIGYAAWRALIPQNPFKGEEWRKKYKAGKTVNIFAGASATLITLALAPAVANQILDKIGMVQGIANYAEVSNLASSNLAKAYMRVGTRMALSNLVGWVGKKTFKEGAEGFEVARRATTGLFALGAFGEGLYNQVDTQEISNRNIPFTNTTLQNLGDKLASPITHIREGIYDRWDGKVDNTDTDKPTEFPIDTGRNYFDLQGNHHTLNSDGSITEDVGPIPPSSQVERDEENLPGDDIELKYKNGIFPYNNEGQLINATYHSEVLPSTLQSDSGYYEVPDDQHTEPENEFEKYIIDPDKDVKKLTDFIQTHQRLITNPTQRYIQPDLDTIVDEHGTLVLGSLVEAPLALNLSADEDGRTLSDTLLEQSQSIIDDIGTELVKDGNIPPNIIVAFDLEGRHFTYYLDQTLDELDRKTSLSEYILKNVSVPSGSEDPDFATKYKVSFMKEFTNELFRVLDEEDEPHVPLKAHELGIVPKSTEPSFYTELAARVYAQDPFEAQRLFEDRLNSEAYDYKFAIPVFESTVANGTERYELLTSGHAEEISPSEHALLVDLMINKEHGILDTSNNYLGSHGITTTLLLNDGTVVSLGALTRNTGENYIEDADTSAIADPDERGIEDELRAEIRKTAERENKTLTRNEENRLVVEAALELAQVAETHNYGKYLERVLIENEGKTIEFTTDDGFTKDFSVRYNAILNQFELIVAGEAQTLSSVSDSKLLIEVLSSKGLTEPRLGSLRFLPTPSIENYDKVISQMETVIRNSPSDLEIKIDPYYSVNGDPHEFYDTYLVERERGIHILGTIIGDKLVRELGYIPDLNTEVILDPKVSEVQYSDYLYSKPEGIVDQIAAGMDTGAMRYYNVPQLMVLNDLGQIIIQNSSRELAEHNLNPDHPIGPVNISIPFSTSSGLAADFNIQFNGGPINFDVVYAATANHINSNLREFETEFAITDPNDPKFQAYVNHHIINELIPELSRNGITFEEITEGRKIYYSVGEGEKLTIDLHQLEQQAVEDIPGSVSRELIKLSLGHTLGKPDSYNPEGLETLTSVALTPLASSAAYTASFWPTVLNNAYNLGEDIRENITNWFFYVVGHPLTHRTIRGSADFIGVAVPVGIDVAAQSANVAANVGTEYAIDTADMAWSLKKELNGIEIFGFRPFTVLDPLLAKPLGTIEYMRDMNRGYAPYSVSGVISHVLEDFTLPLPNYTRDMNWGDLRLDTHYGEVVRTGDDSLAYVVQRGDSVSGISKKLYGSFDYTDDIIRLNPDVIENPNLIYKGEVLRLPDVDRIDEQTDGHGYNPNLDNYEGASTYTVRPGDSLAAIAGQVYGKQTYWQYIYEANKELIGNNSRLIRPGQVLVLPDID